MSLALHGRCGGIPASIALDGSAARSCVSTSFALAHNLPRNVKQVGDDVEITTQGPIVLPTPGGWYTTTMPIRIGYARVYDVVLGLDWQRVVQPRIDGPVVLDPLDGHVIDRYVQWTRGKHGVWV
ncbi:hypothetical protein C2E23DRAFT_612036 [Lenzites betulinus]|nr:hypothetical protein C2E23DRAFT_612036 [Lenzites betulinus]